MTLFNELKEKFDQVNTDKDKVLSKDELSAATSGALLTPEARSDLQQLLKDEKAFSAVAEKGALDYYENIPSTGFSKDDIFVSALSEPRPPPPSTPVAVTNTMEGRFREEVDTTEKKLQSMNGLPINAVVEIKAGNQTWQYASGGVEKDGVISSTLEKIKPPGGKWIDLENNLSNEEKENAINALRDLQKALDSDDLAVVHVR